jgi:hypothetical protein
MQARQRLTAPTSALVPSFTFKPHLKGHFMTSLITKTGSAAVLALLLCSAAQAQQAPAASSQSDWRFFGMASLTFGGDTMVAAPLQNGDTEKTNAGGGLQLSLGVEYTINPDWAVSASLGSHSGGNERSNGEVLFDRVPIEAMVHYSATPEFRLGAGIRSAGGAKLSTSGEADFVSGVHRGDYKASTGLILEGEYFFNTNKKVSLVGRFVQEKFTHKVNGTLYDGAHVGIGLKAYF